MTEVTPEAVAAIMRQDFAEYDGEHMGFRVYEAAYGDKEVVVELCGVDLLPFNPGEGPRALLNDYAAAARKAGHQAYVTSMGVVIIPIGPEPWTETTDPFACIPDASAEYTGTVLETSAEREQRSAEPDRAVSRKGD